MAQQATAIALPVRQNTDEWLQARLDGVTSSDAAVIAGERGSVFALWAIKSRQAPPEQFDEATLQMFDMGHRLEPVIADVYTERTDRPLRRVNRMLRHRDVEWAFASLDRVSAVKGEKRIVELKTNPWTRWGIGEPVPGDVQAQVQHQLWVTGYDVADVAVLIRGYELHIHEIPRDDTFIDNLVFLEREFMRWVEEGTRPPVDGSEMTRKALQQMFPKEYGDVLPATAEFEELARLLQSASVEVKAAANAEATIKNAIRALLGDAAGVAGVDWKITWKKNADSETVDWKSLSSAYRLLLEDLRRQTGIDPTASLDELESIHTTVKPGARVLRPWFANQREEERDIAA